jgi:hypothetical protein
VLTTSHPFFMISDGADLMMMDWTGIIAFLVLGIAAFIKYLRS